jgi:hypothetical protein
MMETEESQKLFAATTEDLVVKIPKDPDKITFEAAEFTVGPHSVCMTGEWGLDFEKINTLEFVMGDKKEKKYIFKKVQV